MRKLIFHEVDAGRVVCRARTERPILVTPGEEVEFRAAIDQYKHQSGRQFPTWSEVLEVLHSIGYEKRIWKPVEAWSPDLEREDSEGNPAEGLSCWYATVETPVGPA